MKYNKPPKIRQLASGTYFYQFKVNGKSVCFSDPDYDKVLADVLYFRAHRPSADKLPENITVGEAISDYIECRRGILSPSTICGYRKVQRNYFLALQKQKVSSLTKRMVQTAVSNEAQIHSAKTVENAYRFISAAIVEANGERFNVTLPKKEKPNKAYFTPEQEAQFLKAIRGHKHEIPMLLGLWSCRNSEIFGLQWEDVDLSKRVIHIRHSSVLDERYMVVDKNTMKTSSSNRVIPIDDRLFELMPKVENKSGRVVTYKNPNSLYNIIKKVCIANDLPVVGVHGLRHSFASLGYTLNIPPKTLMALGGWENDQTMLDTYTHLSKEYITSEAMKLLAYFNSIAAQ